MNQKYIFLPLLLAATGFTAIAQENNNIEYLIKQLDQKNSQIVVKADTAEFVKLMAADFTINRSTGTITSGLDQALQLMRGGMVTYDSFSVQTEFVLIHSPTLVVSMGNEVVVSGGNRELKGQLVRRRFTHVWIKEKGEWKILARHASNVCTN